MSGMTLEKSCENRSEKGIIPNGKLRVVSLKLNKEFKRAYYQGKFKAHPLLVSYRIKNREKKPRFGITTAKKIGCAVKRNRARRIILQSYRELLLEQPELFGGNDFVFVAREKTAESKTDEIKKVMRKQLLFLRNGSEGKPSPKGKPSAPKQKDGEA